MPQLGFTQPLERRVGCDDDAYRAPEIVLPESSSEFSSAAGSEVSSESEGESS